MESCEIKLGVFLAYNILNTIVDMTKIFSSNISQIEIFNTSIKTIFTDKTISKTKFVFIMFKENYRLRLTSQDFGTVIATTVLFRIRALEYLDRTVLSKIDCLQFFSMNTTNFNLGNRGANIWSGDHSENMFHKLEIRGPHTTFSMITNSKNLRYVEFGIIWSASPSNVIPDGFLKGSPLLETIYIHRAVNFTLPTHFMPELNTTKDINLTVNMWNVNFMSLSHQVGVLNKLRLNDTHKEILNGFRGQDARDCKWFCNCLPNGWGACGHCDDDWLKQNCGICVKNLVKLGSEVDIYKILRGTCFLWNSEVINNIKMPPPYPTWAPGDYQPNEGNDYEGVTRRRALGFGKTVQVWLVLLLVITLWFIRRHRVH